MAVVPEMRTISTAGQSVKTHACLRLEWKLDEIKLGIIPLDDLVGAFLGCWLQERERVILLETGVVPDKEGCYLNYLYAKGQRSYGASQNIHSNWRGQASLKLLHYTG